MRRVAEQHQAGTRPALHGGDPHGQQRQVGDVAQVVEAPGEPRQRPHRGVAQRVDAALPDLGERPGADRPPQLPVAALVEQRDAAGRGAEEVEPGVRRVVGPAWEGVPEDVEARTELGGREPGRGADLGVPPVGADDERGVEHVLLGLDGVVDAADPAVVVVPQTREPRAHQHAGAVRAGPVGEPRQERRLRDQGVEGEAGARAAVVDEGPGALGGVPAEGVGAGVRHLVEQRAGEPERVEVLEDARGERVAPEAAGKVVARLQQRHRGPAPREQIGQQHSARPAADDHHVTHSTTVPLDDGEIRTIS